MKIVDMRNKIEEHMRKPRNSLASTIPNETSAIPLDPFQIRNKPSNAFEGMKAGRLSNSELTGV